MLKFSRDYSILLCFFCFLGFCFGLEKWVFLREASACSKFLVLVFLGLLKVILLALLKSLLGIMFLFFFVSRFFFFFFFFFPGFLSQT